MSVTHIETHTKTKTSSLQQHRAQKSSPAYTAHPATIIQRVRATPESLTRTDVLQLQRTIGNQAVGQLLAEIGRLPSTGHLAPVQRQEVPEEEELLQGKMIETVQRQPEPDEEELLQGRFTDECVQCQMPEEEEELMQGKGLTLHAKEEAPPNRTGMPDHLKSGLETISGMDLSGVRVQYSSPKPAQLNALAYTQGQEIHVAPGQDRHLPHEGWHAVQQMQGRVKPTMQARGVTINDDLVLEHEADVMGAKAAQVKRGMGDSRPDLISFSEKKSNVVSSDNAPVQGRFGFEIEVPIFFTSDGGRNDGVRMDPGNAAIDQGAFEVKVDHNEELRPLVSYANTHQNGNWQGFPHGPSIMEIVTKPMDEFALTETDIKDRADNITHWVDNVYNAAAAGEAHLGGNYYVGSDSPRHTLQSTQGYFQTTYGIKISRVPDLFKETAKKGKKNSDDTAAANQLTKAAKAGDKVVKALKKARPYGKTTVQQLATQSELGILKGYTVLLANYICADVGLLTGAGLGKNKIGDYFYKTDFGALSETLPDSVKNILRTYPDILNIFIDRLSKACDRAPDDAMAIGKTVSEWVTHVINGNSDLYLAALKNPNSVVLNSEEVGPEDDRESGVIMENREPQKLDRSSKEKGRQAKREYAEFLAGNRNFTLDQLQDYLRDATDPKKYPMDEWGSMMILIYKLLRQINS